MAALEFLHIILTKESELELQTVETGEMVEV